MQRYFVDKLSGDTAVITGDDARHLIKVMRARAGDTIVCSDGDGREAIAQISEIGADQAIARIMHVRPSLGEPSVRVTVAQSLPKGDKFEVIIQKCTELGAVRFIPFESARTIVQYDSKKEVKRLDRWGKIAKEAAEQAHRGRIPAIDRVMGWNELLAEIARFDLALFSYEHNNGLGLRTALQRFKSTGGSTRENPDILLIIGPEGGFTVNELDEAAAAGAVGVGLGKRILRTETAGMAGLTCILYEYNEMGGSE